MASRPGDAGFTPVIRLVKAALRWPVFWLTALAASAVFWAVAHSWFSQRVVSFDLTLAAAGREWALEWRRASDGLENGVWLDFASRAAEPEILEIRPAGRTPDSSVNPELWLYAAEPLAKGQPPLDLKRFLNEASPECLRGYWVPFEGGPGVVFYGPEPGLLRMQVPGGGIRLRVAKTSASGKVVVAYADDLREFDLRSPTTEPFKVSLFRGKARDGDLLHFVQPLPTYAISSLALRWLDSPGATIRLSGVVLEQRVFGIHVKRRPLRPVLEGDAGLTTASRGQFESRTDAASGTVWFRGDTNLGRTAHAVGFGMVFGALIALRLLGTVAIRLSRRGGVLGVPYEVVAGVVVITVHLGMANWAPRLLAPDSVDYVGDAATLVEDGTFSHFGSYRVPGYSVFIAPFLALFDQFAAALGWGQAILGILTAFCVCGILRPFVPRPWAAVGMLLVGLDPVLLTYERYALTECLTTFCVALAGWLLVRQCVRNLRAVPSVGSIILGGLILGVVCGLSAYVRPNLQMLIVMIPPLLVLGCWRVGVRWRAGAQAAIILVVAVACVTPWILRNKARFGQAQLALGTQANRLAGIWNFRIMDVNQTALFSCDDWQALRARQASGRLSVYKAAPAIADSSRIDKPESLNGNAAREVVYRRALEEATARRPLKTLRGVGVALAVQLGLWTKFKHSNTAEDVHWSAPLRGEVVPGKTNFLFVPEEADHWHRERMIELARRSRINIEYLRSSQAARWFNELFWTFRFTRPLLAVLFLVGLGFALFNRAYPIAGIGLIALAHAVAMAVLVLSMIDRYGAPFKPLMAAVVVYALFRLASGRGNHSEGLDGK